MTRYGIAAVLIFCLSFTGCRPGGTGNTKLEDVAANEEVLRYMKGFESHGEQPDGSPPLAPGKALSLFHHPADLALDLVLAEPDISQPVFINFDHKGRLWVVQYNQYPYPAGLKVTSIDNHDRVSFDKVPVAPPEGEKGADKISFFEDTDGDGKFDKKTDAITGLNIVTSVALGRGNIWVLSPPYLLAYPDPDDNGIPDGPPVVHLRGFGLEDTHAVANSLRWGPDGWLYGAQGSTTTADISSATTKHVAFSGQAIWRYQPDIHVFEIFAEGGGNTFYIEMDEKGRVYSGDNGVTRGVYYKQGGYYTKNWGKHGALTNSYAFGFLPNMGLSGDSLRFTHAWIRYEETNLPERYHGEMIAINPLHRYLQLTDMHPNGSGFNCRDKERILETPDRWFRPVDIKPGPDGAVYIADWYDSRLSHVNPIDNWHKSSGRIYRLRNTTAKPLKSFDLSRYSSNNLMRLLTDKNRWYREEALRQLGDRKDKSLLPQLRNMLESDTGQNALEALWAINLSGGFTDTIARIALLHPDPFVRLWGVRLLGDKGDASPGTGILLARLAQHEVHPEVRSQLASSARRLPSEIAMPVIRNLLVYHDDSDDPDIPLLTWWAIEAKAGPDKEAVLSLFNDKLLWTTPVVVKTILGRLAQRFSMENTDSGFLYCAKLLRKAPGHEQGKIIAEGLQEGLQGTIPPDLPGELNRALALYASEMNGGAIGFALQQGKKDAVVKAIRLIENKHTETGLRISLIRIFSEINEPACIPVLLNTMQEEEGAVLKAALQTLQWYDSPAIGQKVLEAYPDKLRAEPDIREAALSLLASRPVWALQFIQQSGNGKKIHLSDISPAIVQRLQLLEDPQIAKELQRLWPNAAPSESREKAALLVHVNRLAKTGNGDPAKGKTVFMGVCGACHRLFGEGGNVGPDLTGYDRSLNGDLLLNIVEPDASIREGYAYYHFVTADGRNLLGKIVGKKGNRLTIQPLNGEIFSLSTTAIKTMKLQPGSVMPERLLNNLTDQQITDLLAYLLKKDIP